MEARRALLFCGAYLIPIKPRKVVSFLLLYSSLSIFPDGKLFC
jgi:hypothetical protein